MTNSDIAADTPVWIPSRERCERAMITKFQRWLAAQRGLHFDNYEALWSWSVNDLEAFWSAVWDYFDIKAARRFTAVLSQPRMPGATWFEGAQLNIVQQFLRHEGAAAAIRFESEALGTGVLSWDELRDQVARLAAWLRAADVQPGDRVVAILPNIPQAVVAFLATASVGAVWSLCSPDMGPVSVGDRFRQIEPKVLIACDGYCFGGKRFDRRDTLQQILEQLPMLQQALWVPTLDADAPVPSGTSLMWSDWQTALATPAKFAPMDVDANHPLWILYSSGTTGLPKAIVHGHAGVLVNGLVSAVLHGDTPPGAVALWAVSSSWVVWNIHAMNLLAGATILLYDGAVTGPGPQADWSFLWRLAARHQVSRFGAGAAFFHSSMKAGVHPAQVASMDALECINSTGSPLSPEAYRWVYDRVKKDVWLNSASGGTDIAAGFIVGLPTLPVYLGELQCRALGASVQSFDDSAQPVFGEVGELVCTKPLPSMPLYFWGDEGNLRQIESYFDTFHAADGSGIWRHGDWLKLVPRKDAIGAVIYGRSDATINRQGIRMGTSELYRAVEGIDEVVDSLVVDLEYLGRDSYMALFVVLRANLALTQELDTRIRQRIREALSPRHVPNEIVQVAQVPKTLTGKKLELPIKKLMLGQPVERVVNRDALADPEAIDWYIDFAGRYLAAAGANAKQKA